MLDLNDPQIKEKIKEAEKKFETWKKNKDLEDDKWAKERYLARKVGCIYFDDSKVGASKITIRDPEKYSKFSEIFSAISALKRQREYAQNH